MAGEALPPRLELVSVGTIIGWWIMVFLNSGQECAGKAAWVLTLYGAASALAPNYIAAVHEKVDRPSNLPCGFPSCTVVCEDFFFFFVTLVTGPRRSLSLKLSDPESMRLTYEDSPNQSYCERKEASGVPPWRQPSGKS